MKNSKSSFSAYYPQIAFTGAILIALSLTASRALLSIGTGILVLAALLKLWEDGIPRFSKSILLAGCLSLFFFLPLATFFWTENQEAWSKDISIKLPFLLLPISLAILPAFSQKQLEKIILVFVSTQSIILILSLIQNAFFSGDELSSSGPVMGAEIITGINHIYFGTILGFAAIAGTYWGLLHRKASHSLVWNALIVLGIIAVIGLHLLNSRTGMLSFYGGCAALIIGFSIRTKRFKLGIIASLMVILIPVIFYQLSDTLRTRVDDAVSETLRYSESKKSGDFSTQPAGLRLLAWEASLDIIARHPILGTGPGDIASDLMAWYDDNGVTTPKKFLLPSAHNQYLENQSGLGILGSLILLFALILPLANPQHRPISLLLLSFLGICAIAMLTESILERQIGISFFCFWVMLLYREEG